MNDIGSKCDNESVSLVIVDFVDFVDFVGFWRLLLALLVLAVSSTPADELFLGGYQGARIDRAGALRRSVPCHQLVHCFIHFGLFNGDCGIRDAISDIQD